MGSMTFTRSAADGEVLSKVSFDSSPKYSLCKAHGFVPSTFRLDRTGGDNLVTRYDVYASTTEGGKAAKVGVLTAKSTEAIRAER